MEQTFFVSEAAAVAATILIGKLQQLQFNCYHSLEIIENKDEVEYHGFTIVLHTCLNIKCVKIKTILK